MKYFLSFILFAIVTINSGFGQTLSWQNGSTQGMCFSSAAVADLNGDGTKDVVLGAGEEDEFHTAAIFAFDGQTGTTLWALPARSQIYTQPLFQDISGDSLPDVFIGGRAAQLLAINGATGEVIWEFFPDTLGNNLDSGWYNFYSPQWIGDKNQDGYSDMVISNGGFAPATSGDTLRPAGYLMVLSGKNGSIIAMDTTPDNQEIYYSPAVIDIQGNGTQTLFFGTGGEVTHGSFWYIPLDSLLAGSLTTAQILDTHLDKGYIALSSFADLNLDGYLDIIVPCIGGKISAYNLKNKQKIWDIFQPNGEGYMSPSMGNFNGDNIPDAFVTFALGVFPFYSAYRHLWIDGGNGNILRSDTTQYYQMHSPSVYDWDADGIDDIIWMENTDVGFATVQYRTQLSVWNLNANTKTPLTTYLPGLNPYSQPLITDLNADGNIDILYVHNLATQNWYLANGFAINCTSFSLPASQIAWAGYMGTNLNCVFSAALPNAISNETPIICSLFPNPTKDEMHITTPFSSFIFSIFDMEGKLVFSADSPHSVSIEHFAKGVYRYVFQSGQHLQNGKLIKL